MWSHQLLGYSLLENPATVRLINELYRDVWGPLHNFFLPSTKLVEKRREGSGSCAGTTHPQTAYQRLVASGELNRKVAARLRDQFAALDPLALARSVNQRLKKS